MGLILAAVLPGLSAGAAETTLGDDEAGDADSQSADSTGILGPGDGARGAPEGQMGRLSGSAFEPKVLSRTNGNNEARTLILSGKAAPAGGASGMVDGLCFGRRVVLGDYTSRAYLLSDKGEGYDYRMFSTQQDVMHVMRFKTDKSGSQIMIYVVYDEGFTKTNFISPTPCDYEWAYRHNLANIADHYGVPVFTDKEADDRYREAPAVYGRKDWYGLVPLGNPSLKNPHLLPNTFYYLHAINVDLGLARGFSTSAQLAAAPETCQGNRGGGYCYYLKFDIGGGVLTDAPEQSGPPGSGGPGSGPPDASTCALPDGTRLAAGTDKSVMLWYKAGEMCVRAAFYCANGSLTYGLQMSPSPPQPPPGARFFMTPGACR